MNKFLLIIALMLASPSAFAGFSIVGGVDYSLDSTSVLGIETIKGGLGFGGGLLYNFSAIEIGALYMSKKTSITYSSPLFGTDSSTSYGGVEIPVMVRMGGLLTNFGIGGFYDLPISTGGSSNYGLTAGPHIGFPGGLFFDVRFNYGLKSLPVTGSTKDLLAMIGFAFGGK